METEELIKLVDGIYKNILDKFNPGARQMINAGKAYLKALHSAAAASRLYVDAISKLAKQAQQGTWGGSSDIGGALMKIVEVYKEIQDQQMNILKAFYVDLLVPLETNLEKDTKVVQSEQKRFLQQHKQRSETYSKAAAMMKKQRKKSRGSTKTGLAMDKELKNMQVLEEEKTKLDTFCEISLKNAMTQERRRYGFVLERQCSLAKHYLSYHSQGVEAYQQNIEKWSEVAKTREYLPESVENIFTTRLRQISVWQDEDLYSNPRSPNFEDDRMSITSQLRKTKSMDASCLDIRSIGDADGSPVNTLSRAKSEYNLNTSTQSLAQDGHTLTRRPKSMAVPPPPTWDTQLARALYAYLSSGENQLSFHEGDLIALIGDRNKGWQFGENLRTQCSGWFPLAYTEVLDDPSLSPSYRIDNVPSGQSQHSNMVTTPTSGSNAAASSGGSATPSGNNTLEQQPTRMFGDTLHLQRSSNNAKQIRRAIGFNNVPPPALPAPVPTPSLPCHKTGITQSQSAHFPKSISNDTSTFQSPYSHPATGIKSSTSTFNFSTTAAQAAGNGGGPYSTHPQPSRSDRPTAGAPLPLHLQSKEGKIGVPVGNVSLHSSNDSGFSNDPPPQPEIDYSDDDSIPGQTKLPSRRVAKEINGDTNNNSLMRKPHPIKQSNSHGNLVDRKAYYNDDDISLRDQKKLVKRTKSFWKFGKNNSDSEILEGMALWRHRDLVDVVNEENARKRRINSQQRVRRPSRDRSSDSDRTINGKQSQQQLQSQTVVQKGSSGKENNSATATKLKHHQSFNDKQNKVDEHRSSTVTPPKPKERSLKKDIKNESYHQQQTLQPHPRFRSENERNYHNYEMGQYERNGKPMDDQFYDDDGLMMKTVNRKNILQQYNNESGTDSESESDLTSDPYDCIVVDDQNVRNDGHNFPNVAELGKKLEKLSKSNKYSPNRTGDNNNINNMQEKNNRRNNSPEKNIKSKIENNDNLIHYQERYHNDYVDDRRPFKTFGKGDDREDDINENEYYAQNFSAANKENSKEQHQQQQKRRYYEYKTKNNNKNKNRKPRTSYESIDSDVDHRRMITSNNNNNSSSSQNNKSENSKNANKMKYYESSNDVDELSEVENRQFLPRTKLSKTNSSNSSKYNNCNNNNSDAVEDDDIGLMEYGETLQKRLKNPEYGSKYDVRSPHNGNMYGPWYDLWGLDASVKNK